MKENENIARGTINHSRSKIKETNTNFNNYTTSIRHVTITVANTSKHFLQMQILDSGKWFERPVDCLLNRINYL